MIYHGSYEKVLSHVQADLIFTSPPYNIGSKAPRRDGFRSQGKYDPKSYAAVTGYKDNLPEPEYQDSQVRFLDWCDQHLSPNGHLVYNHKPRRVKGQLIHPMEWIQRSDLQLIDEIVWDRGSTHNHSPHMMWQTTERLYVLQRKGAKLRRIDTKLLHRSDCWRIRNRADSSVHCAPFPLALAQAVLHAYSEEGDLVVDPYTGSGTTAIAAQRMGRRFEGSEKLKKYWRLAIDNAASCQ